ncbi:Hypothetical protein B591_04849 [Streptomyces sp. GBA 94-10 4N24]|nr:Hypothetical protein B591_04849 [Streptomyces sp. GBA 94-10 4N24]UZN57988.1 Hypothetical protein B591N_04849 [Streptomyces sp. GBA 94-10 4N24]
MPLWDRQLPPGAVCASASCQDVFLTQGAGPTRRYCSRRCATRERVAAHRRARARTGIPTRAAPLDRPHTIPVRGGSPRWARSRRAARRSSTRAGSSTGRWRDCWRRGTRRWPGCRRRSSRHGWRRCARWSWTGRRNSPHPSRRTAGCRSSW